MSDRQAHVLSEDGTLPTTRWTLIARLQTNDAMHRRRALDEICAQYHYPLYCYIRRRGLDHHDAQDVLHDFLAKLLRNDSFGEADAEKGRLRSFLLNALQRFLVNWRRDQQHRDYELSIDSALVESESRYQQERFMDDESPDRVFERQWARQMMGHVMRSLKAAYDRKNKSEIFATLSPVLLSGGSLVGEDSETLASSLGMKGGSLRMALRRLLDEYRETLRAEIAQTIVDPEQIKEEFQYLARVVGK